MNEYKIEHWHEETAPETAKLKRIMQAAGFSVFEWTDAAGAVYGKHQHGEDQSHWIISGELELTIENAGTIVLKAGDRDFMPANTVHSARVSGGKPVTYLIGA